MQQKNIPITMLFKSQEAAQILPQEIVVTLDLKLQPADIDVVIAGYHFPELTNATIQNYLCFEQASLINIIVVEGSGNMETFDHILSHDSVSRVLIHEDIHVNHPRSTGSFGMALSSAVGQYFSISPYVFFSHSDMIGCKENFLSYIKSKLTNNIRLASFTQRHMIPFTGCMMVNRSLFEETRTDWLLYDSNVYINQVRSLKEIADRHIIPYLTWVDCGESFIYEEISKGNPVYACASRGGIQDYWKDPFSYFEIEAQELFDVIQESGCPIMYAPLQLTKEAFEKKYKDVLNASKFKFWEKKIQRKYWRYCFDDEGDLIFVHHGRGTTQRQVKRWLKFTQKFNAHQLNNS